ncbi:MAG: FAD-binding protein [Solirubrobacterales bacterium]
MSELERIRAVVRDAARVRPAGAGTKWGLTAGAAGAEKIEVSVLRGIIEYDPAELTITALAGTPISELQERLAAHGQHLPFDPPLRAAGATIGGTVAAGVSGPGAFGPGAVRDFVIGIRFVDGRGRLVSAGGRVVKNAAGFDLPKLFVGSAGRLGVITEVSCKVFPAPAATITLISESDSLSDALERISTLGRGPTALIAVDLVPPGTLLVRIGGASGLMDTRASRLSAMLGAADRLVGEDERRLWDKAAEFGWAPDHAGLLRVPVTPSCVAALDRRLENAGVTRRYSLGANLAWIGWPADTPLGEIDSHLRSQGLSGMVVKGDPERSPFIGQDHRTAFSERVTRALDPEGKFAGQEP